MNLVIFDNILKFWSDFFTTLNSLIPSGVVKKFKGGRAKFEIESVIIEYW